VKDFDTVNANTIFEVSRAEYAYFTDATIDDLSLYNMMHFKDCLSLELDALSFSNIQSTVSPIMIEYTLTIEPDIQIIDLSFEDVQSSSLMGGCMTLQGYSAGEI